MHEYTVEFRIQGIDLDVSSVTETLGVEPCIVRNVGDRKSESERWHEALWAYNGFPESQGAKSWQSLEEGLTLILDRLWQVRTKISAYPNHYKVSFWCGHFQTSANGGPTLSPTVLRRLGEFGVELFIDNYFCEETR